jgi:hypothetical protein
MAVLKSAVPGGTMAEIEAALTDGALDLGAAGPDNDSGAGLVDVVEAYMLLSSSTPPPSDADGDGVPDDSDLCPGTPPGETADPDGCSASQRDSDGDGVSDADDLCPDTPAGTSVDASGCPLEPQDNIPPVANDDSAVVPRGEGNSVRFNLTDNDTDADGAIDPDSIAVVGQPSQATVIVHNDGSGDVTVTLTSKRGKDRSFSYTVQDNLGATSNAATVDVAVN